MCTKIAKAIRDEAYAASIEIAREKSSFPLFDAEQYLAAPRFASRLPEKLKSEIRQHGIRNSHLLSIAPTGTISLAFADNASNGIEPPFSWTYQRKKRMPDNSMKTYDVEDHAWRLYRHLGGDMGNLPPRPPYPARCRPATRALEPALAGAAETRRRQSVVDLHGGVPNRPIRDFRRPRRERRPARVRGVGKRSRAAARPGGGGEDALHGHARAGPGVAQDEARDSRAHRGRRRLRLPDAARWRIAARAERGGGVRAD